MQLDKTSIIISERSITELSDLSLVVMRSYAGPVFRFGMLGAIPFLLLNLILTWPLMQYDQLAMSATTITSSEVYRIRYYCVMIGAVFLQAPLAMCFVTYFIGQAVFFEQQSWQQVVNGVFSRAVPVIMILGVLRLGLISFVPLAILFVDPEFRPEIELTIYLFGMCLVTYCVRAFRPFAPEILVLEKSPLRRKTVPFEQQSFRQRSNWLHATQYNDTFGSHILCTMIAGATTLSMCFGCIFLSGVLFGAWDWAFWMDLIAFPLVLWCVATWMTVMRFLFYMNSRIRTEGWEIELRLKAESERLKEVLA